MSYALNIEKSTGRILSACDVLPHGKYSGMPIVFKLPDGDMSDYRYVNGEYVHDPLPAEGVVEKPSQLDVIEAQVTYTAMMTNTLLGV